MSAIPEMPSILLGFILTLILIQSLKRPAYRLQLVDSPGVRKHHIGVIPLIGGVAMVIAFLLSVFVLGESLQDYYGLFAGMILLTVVGLIDDFRELSARSRLMVQAVAAVLIILADKIYLSDLGDLTGLGEIELYSWSIPVTIFCVVGVINALNMIDGLDGLAGGMSLITVGWLIMLALASGSHDLDATLLGLLGAILAGFLCFNLRHPWRQRASVFMGNSGSMVLGFMLAWFLVDLSQGEQRAFTPITAVWILGLPLLDTVGIMIRRVLNGQSPFTADRQHLHHVLLRAGYSDAQAVGIMLIISGLLGAIGMVGWYFALPDYVLFYVFVAVFSLYLYVLMRACHRVKKTSGFHEVVEKRKLQQL